MAYSDNFPAVRPVFQADFANGGRIDPRATFSRASTAFVADGSKHLSSENLLLQSSDFDTSWSKQGLATPTGGQSDPAGGTDGFTLVEDSNGGYHRIYQSMSQTGDLALTVYAKQTTGTRYLILTLFNASNDYEAAVFDLAGGAAATSSGSSSTYTSVSTSQTASGDSYYKCVLKATGTVTTVSLSLNDSASAGGINSSGLDGYGGDGTSSIDLAFASLSTTGATDYNATTTQIHREYASSLVSKANNIGRFEVGVDGQSEGILIEGQAQNLLPSGATGYNSSNVFNWSRSNTSVTKNAAVAPTGSLEATLIYDNNAATTQHRFDTVVTATAAAHTFSGYFKSAGHDDIVVRVANDGNSYGAQFTFSTQTAANYGTAFSSLSIRSVGNGWYRFVATTPTLASGSTNIFINLLNGSLNYTGDDYSGVLFYGLQFEANAFASSVIATVDAAATRAADSLSVATADIPGFSEGVGTIVCETGGVASATETNQLAFGLNGPASSNLFSAGVNNGGVTDSTVRVYSQTPDGDQAFLNPGTATVGTGYKLACRYELDNIAASMNGGTVVSDTSGKVPVGIDTLWVGELEGNYHINSNIKRIAIYGEALSDTNLISLTS